MNIENFDRELLARYLNNEVNSREKMEVENWVNQSEENRAELEEKRKILLKVDIYFKAKNFDSNNAWSNVRSKITQGQQKVIQLKKKRKEAVLRFYKYAAILLIALLLGSLTYYAGFRNQTKTIYAEMASAGGQSAIEQVLPDGTIVTLNGNSQLTFPKRFKNNVREVTLKGEGFFDVKPNPEKPFVIDAGEAQVKVLGTSFNVAAYPESETVEVIVKTGKVQVSEKTHEKSSLVKNEIFLNPGEKGTLFIKERLLEKTVNINPNFLSWKTHDLVFDKVPLQEVIQCLEKVYNVDIEITDTKINDLLLKAHFDKKPIDFVLDVVRITFNLELTKTENGFILSDHDKEQAKL